MEGSVEMGRDARPVDDQAALRRRDRFFDISSDLLCILGFDGFFEDLNPAWEEVLGFPRAELLSRPFIEFVHPEDREKTLALLETLRDTGEVSRLENRYRTREGDWRTLGWVGTIVPEEKRYYGAARDLTERRDDLVRLQRSEARLAEAQRVAGIGSWEWVLASGRVAWSDELFRIFGVERGEARQTYEGFLGRVPEDDRDRVRRTIDRALEARKPFVVEHRIVRPDGEVRHLESRGHPHLDEGDAVVRFFGTAQDVTEQRATEVALRESEEHVRQLQRIEAIGRLAGGVAHDVNNLLMVVRGFADLLGRRVGGEGREAEYLEEIRKATDRGASLTSKLLAFGRRQVLRPVVLDLADLVLEMEPMVRRLIREDIDLVVVPGDEPCRVEADPTRMEQVVLNLVVNARDAMSAGGHLRVEMESIEAEEPVAHHGGALPPGGWVRLAVQDDGSGMDEETLAQAFDPFFTTKDPAVGTGLGLSTVHGIVHQSGGRIFCESTPGRGTTVTVYLPRVTGPTTRRAGARSGPVPLARRLTVLLAEDQDEVRAVIGEHLRSRRHRVLEVRNGAEALLAAREHDGRFDLLVTDVVMPRMNGRSLVRRLRARRPDLPVVYISGYAGPDVHADDEGGERDAFLGKPFAVEDLDRAVRELLEE